MPHALLLSPDDQAVNAITGVLEEMSVTCERPLDGVSAAHKLNSHSFDLVLVDCENLPAAKLIFDVCRRGKDGHNPVPIAIVDGRAGLPTAFRLGAELILTKPVAKDQARSTIRNAVSRVRKDVPAEESVPAQTADASMPSVAETGAVMNAVMNEERAQAAAAATASAPSTSFAEPAPSFVATSASTAAFTVTLSAPAVAPKMNFAVDDEIDTMPASPKPEPQTASTSAASLADFSESFSTQAAAVDSKPVCPASFSDDSILAELERTELAEPEPAESQPEDSGLAKTALAPPAVESSAPVLSSPRHSQKPRISLVALLMLALAGGGFYAAWTYQPGFRAIVQPQIDRLLTLAGIAYPMLSVPPAPSLSKPPVPPAPVTASAPAPESPTDPNRTLSTVADSAASSAAATAATPAAAPVPVQPAAAPRNAQLPGESSAIILSSKGAEKRLEHSVPPKYPAAVQPGAAQGTIVLKEVVDENGKVEGLRLVEGNAALASAAIEAVKQWRYRPYVRDGKAQPFQTVVILDFQRP